MTNPKYATPEHREQRAYWKPIVDRGEALCVEPVCLHRSRQIEPGSDWDVSHDPTGTHYLGPSHAKCNRSEGAARGNKQRTRRPSLWWSP